MSSHRLHWYGAKASAALGFGAARALHAAADHVLDASNDNLVPLDDGELRDSGRASVDDNGLVAAVSYDTDYAVRQHEQLDLQHDPGRSAKYLERALIDEAAPVRKIIAAHIERELT